MKLLLNIIFYIFCLTPLSLAQQNRDWTGCIVIDPGHGGKDPGAVNGALKEKNITLSVALKMGELLQKELPKAKIVYTRRTDVFVTLSGRTKIANSAQADVFISIHTNAAPSSQAHGTETYVMGTDKTGANMAVAMRENDVVAMESDHKSNYAGFRPGSSESYIMFSMISNAHQEKSLALAGAIQREFGAGLTLRNRGVKQAGYLVLWRTAMPSVLTEIGFISNPSDSKFLATTAAQHKIAALICKATVSYLSGSDGRVGGSGASESSSAANATGSGVKATSSGGKATGSSGKATGSAATASEEISYRILALQSTTKKEINSRNFGPYVSVVEQVRDNNSYKYYIDRLFSHKEAVLLHRKIVEFLPSAQIVAFRGAKQIKVDEAKKVKP